MSVSGQLYTFPLPPSPTQQQSTDNKLGLMLCQRRSRRVVASILTMISEVFKAKHNRRQKRGGGQVVPNYFEAGVKTVCTEEHDSLS